MDSTSRNFKHNNVKLGDGVNSALTGVFNTFPNTTFSQNNGVIDRRGLLIMAISFGFGLGVTFEPTILEHFPPIFKSIFSSGITTGGLTAIVANVLLPKSLRERKLDRMEDEIGV